MEKPTKIILGIDAREGRVATHGWLDVSQQSALELAGALAKLESASASVELAPEPVVPRPQHADIYAEAYGAYRRLFDGVEGALA